MEDRHEKAIREVLEFLGHEEPEYLSHVDTEDYWYAHRRLKGEEAGTVDDDVRVHRMLTKTIAVIDNRTLGPIDALRWAEALTELRGVLDNLTP